MAWCRQATSHYLSQCWPRSLSPYDITRPQWVNIEHLLLYIKHCPSDICWHTLPDVDQHGWLLCNQTVENRLLITLPHSCYHLHFYWFKKNPLFSDHFYFISPVLYGSKVVWCMWVEHNGIQFDHDTFIITCQQINTLRPRQNGRHFPDDILKWIFLNENIWISIKIALKFVPSGSINNIPALVQIMAWHRPGDKPLSEPGRCQAIIWTNGG